MLLKHIPLSLSLTSAHLPNSPLKQRTFPESWPSVNTVILNDRIQTPSSKRLRTISFTPAALSGANVTQGRRQSISSLNSTVTPQDTVHHCFLFSEHTLVTYLLNDQLYVDFSVPIYNREKFIPHKTISSSITTYSSPSGLNLNP